MEAERLELLAQKAALESERAQLVAERKRLELEKMKATRAATAAASAASSASAADAAATSTGGSATGDSNPIGSSVSGTPGNVTESSQSTDSSQQTPNNLSSPQRDSMDVKDQLPLPGPLINELLGVDFPRLDPKDIETVQSKVLTMNNFYVTGTERSPFGERVVFRGNLRGEAKTVFAEAEAAVEREGLSERLRLFLLVDPRLLEAVDAEQRDKPVFVALPATTFPNQTTIASGVVSVIAALASIFTCLSYGIGIFGLNPTFLNQLAQDMLTTEQALYTLPISVGCLGLVLVHEIAHRVAAALRDVKLGLPVFLPSLQIGCYGSITPLQSYPRDRARLFDVAASGPVVASLVSTGVLVAGLALTATTEVADWFPQIPTALFRSSLFVGSLGNLILPEAMRDAATVAVHPLTVVGYTGVLVNALNLLPIGRLDGGRIIQALYGRSVAARISGLTFVLQGIATIFGNSSLLLFWSLVCIVLQREGDYPCLEEVTEPSDSRFVIGLSSLVFMLAVLTPVPEQLFM